jgi:hypothetical protein
MPEQPTNTIRETPQVTLEDLPFENALASFKTWYAGLTPAEQLQVEHAMADAEAITPTPIPVEEPAAAA